MIRETLRKRGSGAGNREEDMIRLHPVTEKNIRELTGLSVREDQKTFVAANDVSIMEAYLAITHKGKAMPFGIYDDQIPVGFCMIGYGTDEGWEDAPQIARDSYNLWRFMIDARHQGKGYGREALRQILAWIAAFPLGPARCCWLSYEPDNAAAQALYASFGFRETGERDGDEVIAVLDLSQPRIEVRYAGAEDRAFWFSLDRHLPPSAFDAKVKDRMAYVLTKDGEPAGVLRCSLFWDTIPFCNLVYIRETEQRKGLGRQLMTYWENDMRDRGYDLVLTSTQSDEAAQHVYRKLGYTDCGGLTLPFPGFEQPMELILGKKL